MRGFSTSRHLAAQPIQTATGHKIRHSLRASPCGFAKEKRFVQKRYTNEEFINILMQHVPLSSRHAMRYFGLLSPRSKARLWGAIFVLLNQQQRPHPVRSSWRWLRLKTCGTDPLLDSLSQPMHWVGRQAPVNAD